MNKRGAIFLGLSLGIFLFIMGVLIMPFILDDITTARTSLDCGGDSISDGTKLVCLLISGLNPYYIWLFTSLAVGLIIGGARR